MALIRQTSDISAKWASVTPGRRAEYEKGIAAPLKDWEANTLAAEATYGAAITEAIARNAYGRGVKSVGTAKWQKKAREVGPSRWTQGIGVAQPDYEVGFAPYRDIIERVTLPPRGVKGDPGNLRRVEIIAKALHDKKISTGR